MATIAAHDEPLPPAEAVGERMAALPEKVSETRRCKLGTHRGLEFGLILHPLGGAEVYLDGAVTRRAALLRGSPGPRAVLNALERLADGYESEVQHVREDWRWHRGSSATTTPASDEPFPHGAYLGELTDLRDRLKAGLSQATPEPHAPPVAELAERIQALRAAHTVEAAPERTAPRRAASAEEPVTSRIRRRIEPVSAAEPVEAEPTTAATVIPLAKATENEPPALPVAISPSTSMPAAPARPQPAYGERLTRSRRQPDLQLSLF